ncbi:hypothetical protein P170DRAFT_483704 [Aspergillus steynii IBT 23096]|uniref:Fe2OG dioxygenase domain-containing protein n=1 Tax=Aspergillus steynii IBT 23096 TaxID=1392250 RepID=A0A2I2GPV0_9EURO|nr:uncharacterized protein P170DRAFT_483704 [Aspergillus steynii IBT 23096]PLB54904.1 hypothetical protein P170DRAFT_483704 [Aspergillus steynii IBT 23096]
MAPAALGSPRLAPTVVGPTTKKATRPTRQLPRSLIEGAKVEKKMPFDPDTHIIYQPPEKIHLMSELGLEGAGISPNAISEPFPLFSEAAIKQMRAEIFSDPVLADCQYASTFCTNMIRGMGHQRAPFVYDAWKSSRLLSSVSEVAGVDLVPAWEYEVANINIAVKDDDEAESSIDQMVDVKDDNTAAFGWHYDSFPFVCVAMLSDCTHMVGGETAVQLPSGDIKKFRGPAMGYAVVMQGRYLQHQALKAIGGRERISMVTPFRPKDPLVRDEIVLVGVRGISNLSEVYPQYYEYRLDVLEERIRARKKAERARETAYRPFSLAEERDWIRAQRDYLDSMLNEMYEVK